MNLEVLHLRDVVNLALDSCRPEAERKGQQLTVIDETDSALTVNGDRVRLTQVVSNLVSNATKYTGEGGYITVRIARDGERARIKVKDTGIRPGSLPRVFELFAQVHGHQAYSAGGLGIGLALVKQLVEMHGGSAMAASEGADSGSTFAVHLPVAMVEVACGLFPADQGGVDLIRPSVARARGTRHA